MEGALPTPLHPPHTPKPQGGSTYRLRLRAGSCWLQERKKASQSGWLVGQAAVWKGEMAGCLLDRQALGTGSSLRHEQIRGRWKGLGLPLSLRSDGPGVCTVVREGQ